MISKEDHFYRQVLPNGLTVIFEKRDMPVIAVMAAAKFGSAHEPQRLKGIAHFIEHSAIKGTKSRSNLEICKEIEKKGAEWNAFTAEEETAFWIKIGSKHIGTSFDIISDMMLNASFGKKEIETERGVILEEIKMYHDLPNYYVHDKLKEALYSMPFGLSALGTKEIIGKVQISTLKNFHSLNYSPSNIILSVVGKADFDDVVGLARRYFAGKSRQMREKRFSAKEGNFSKTIEKRKSIDQAQIALGMHMPTRMSEKRYAAEIFNAYLGEGMASPLFQEIRVKRGLAYAVSSSLDQGRDYCHCAISVGTVKEKIDEVRRIILKEIKKAGNLGKKDLDETKEQLIGRYHIVMENSSRTAQAMLYEELTKGAESYYEYPEKISEVRLEDVRRLAKIKNYGFIAVVPE